MKSPNCTIQTAPEVPTVISVQMCKDRLARLEGKESPGMIHMAVVLCARWMDSAVALTKSNACIEKWEAGYYR